MNCFSWENRLIIMKPLNVCVCVGIQHLSQCEPDLLSKCEIADKQMEEARMIHVLMD